MSLCPDKRGRKGKFRRGAEDVFRVEAADVGRVGALRIGHDGSSWAPGWHLAHVTLRQPHPRGKGTLVYHFPCDAWLAKDEGDGAIVRDLAPADVHLEREGPVATDSDDDGATFRRPLSSSTYRRASRRAGSDASEEEEEEEWPGPRRTRRRGAAEEDSEEDSPGPRYSAYG